MVRDLVLRQEQVEGKGGPCIGVYHLVMCGMIMCTPRSVLCVFTHLLLYVFIQSLGQDHRSVQQPTA